MSYCRFAATAPAHQEFHATEHGFPIRGESALFERLVLEISQAGLSWDIILKRRHGMAAAFDHYDVAKIAAYDEDARARLLTDARIIRNRLKIAAIIYNAAQIMAMRDSHGGFAAWLDAHHPQNLADWVKIFRKNFRFTGGEIVHEFLMGVGYLPDAHDADCPIAAQVLRCNPPWQTPWQTPRQIPR
ncbi:MAG: DNA-3-methyladenine glycosylase I [Candidatus Symbiobacter sp.]|nr:DNA-3-methyladenine glycosylase I [Candidatus Symbiobacter sp.]